MARYVVSEAPAAGVANRLAKVKARHGIDQLGRDPDVATVLAHAPLQYGPDIEFVDNVGQQLPYLM